MRRIILIAMLFCPLLTLSGQKDTLTFRVVSYNVENLFDYRHDSLKNDGEFLPEAVRHWNKRKYRKKLNDIARVIIASGEWTAPALVGLCEVENDAAMHALTRQSVMRKAKYRYVMTDSPDERGIDVALVYRRDLFKLLSSESLAVAKPKRESRPTRDILHVTGLLPTHDTLDVFVAHFPSRRGGAKESEPYRLLAARRIRDAVDSLCRVRRHPQVILMGDFNDYPRNRSVSEVLGAQAPSASDEPVQPCRLYHLLAAKAEADKQFGSYKYQGKWGLLDHIIVSGTLLQAEAPLQTNESRADIVRLPFLMTDDKKFGGNQPFRTYYGVTYQGGYSDHLPVRADFLLCY